MTYLKVYSAKLMCESCNMFFGGDYWSVSLKNFGHISCSARDRKENSLILYKQGIYFSLKCYPRYIGSLISLMFSIAFYDDASFLHDVVFHLFMICFIVIVDSLDMLL